MFPNNDLPVWDYVPNTKSLQWIGASTPLPCEGFKCPPPYKTPADWHTKFTFHPHLTSKSWYLCISLFQLYITIFNKYQILPKHNGLFQKKNPRLRIYFFEPAPVPWSFRFATLPLKVPEETSSHPWNYAKFCDTPSNFECQKPRPMEIQQEFLVNSLGNSTPF